MFKGNNTLQMNQSTMVQAIQLWVDSQFKVPPKVVSVRVNSRGGTSTEFEVDLQEAKDANSSV